MSGWKTVAAMLTVVFVIALVQAVLAQPAVDVINSFNETDKDLSDDLNPSKVADDLKTAWFDMGLVGMFGIIAWGAYRVLKDELTRGGGRI